MKTRLPYLTRISFLIIFILVSMPLNASAGVTGRLKGKVIDKETREPLAGAVIRIEGTYLETTTNTEGKFAFIGITAGTYTIEVLLASYAVFHSNQTVLFPDQVTELMIELVSSTNQSETVVKDSKTAARFINPNQTINLLSDDFKMQPYRHVADIITNSTSSVYQRNGAQFVRGGAHGEMGYFLNGIPLNVGFTNSMFSQIPYGAIDHITVNTGGYNAKYGGFGSGITHIIPKRGGDGISGSAEYVTDAAAAVMGSESYGRNIYSVTFGGPILKKTLRFFTAGELSKTDDTNPGAFGYPILHYRKDGARSPDPSVNDSVVFETDGNGNVTFKKGPAPERSNSGQWINLYGNVSYTPGTGIEVDAITMYSFEKRNIFSPSQLLMPGLVPHRERTTLLTGVSTRYVISPSLFLQGRVNYYSSTNETIQRNLFDKGSDAALFLDQYSRGNSGYTTYYNDNLLHDIDRGSLVYQKSESESISGGMELGWNWNQHHFIQAGLTASLHTTRSFDLDPGNPLYGTHNYYGYTVAVSADHFSLKDKNSGLDGAKKPVVGSLFVQDDFTWENMSINGGVHWDYFNTGTKELKNLANPTGGDSLSETDYRAAKSKTRISPRISFSVEADKRLIINGHYGWYYQIPAFSSFYVGSDFLERQSLAPIYSGILGNPNLNWQKTELIAIGFNFKEQDIFSVSGTMYRKNISHPVGVLAITSMPNGLLIYSNSRSANIEGLELTFEGRITENLTSGASIAFLDAEGSHISENSGFRAAWLGYEITKSNASLDYEQKRTIRFHALYQLQKNEGPMISGIHPFENMSFYALGNWQSGFPYTPTTVVPVQVVGVSNQKVVARRNSERMPSIYSMDIKIAKHFTIAKDYRAAMYIEILNVLDRKNVTNVFTATGKGNDDGFLGTTYAQSWSTRQIQQYQYIVNDNSHYSNPRLVNMGLQLEF